MHTLTTLQARRLRDDQRKRWPALALLGIYPVLGGVSSFFGWMFDLPRLTDWTGSGIALLPNAAICCAFCGLGLLLLAKDRATLGATAGLAAALIGGLTLCEWLFGANFGIDSLFMFDREWGSLGVMVPGRMGPAGSLAWTLIGLGLAMSSRRGKLQRLAPPIALLTFGISLLSVTGHVYGVDVLYALPRLSMISLQTASFISALSVGLIVLHPDLAPMRWFLRRGAIGIIARRSIPALIVGPILIGWLQLMGARAGWYETSFGTALLMLALTALLSVVMWRALLVAARHEVALLASEQRMKLAIDAGEAVTWDADLRSGKIVWSESHFRLLGLATTASTEVTQAMFENAVLVEDLPAVQLEWQRAEAAHDVYRTEYRLRRMDGSIRWIRAAGRCLYDRRGRAIRFVGVLFDVTEEKLAIETLRQADRRKNEFLATLAH